MCKGRLARAAPFFSGLPDASRNREAARPAASFHGSNIAIEHVLQNLDRQRPDVGKSLVANPPPCGIQCRDKNVCIFSREIILTGLSDARYPFIDIREVRWPPFLT